MEADEVGTGGRPGSRAGAPALALDERRRLVRGATDWFLDAIAAEDRAIAQSTARRSALLLGADRARRLDDALQDEQRVERGLRARAATDISARSLRAEIATTMRIPERAAERLLVESSSLLDQHIATFRALASGDISPRHATEIATALAAVPAGRREQLEARALEAAEGLTPGELAQRLRRWSDDEQPETLAVRHERALDRRDVHVTDVRDGMSYLEAYLPTITAHAIRDRLTRMAGPIARAEREAAERASASRGRGGRIGAFGQPLDDDGALLDGALLDGALLDGALLDGALLDGALLGGALLGGAGLDGAVLDGTHTDAEHTDAELADAELADGDDLSPRSVGQVRADIAESLLLGAAAVDLPDAVNAIRGEVVVTVPVLTLAGGDLPASLDGVVPIDPATARRLAGAAPSLERILTHPETGAVLSVSRTRYRPPAELRRAVQLRDGTCRFAGCRVPANRCEVDHTVDWAASGTTSLDNLMALCVGHHTLKHATGWSVRQMPGAPAGTGGPSPASVERARGAAEWISPGGRRYRTHPALELPRHPDASAAPARAPDPPPF